ncbi:cuticle protein 19-like [Danaus plexippus]|uniref:cuticle protein 19-like n=1 Tax=Danaus plexippus TaxID=13037 RepID=UPI002AB17C14|nr:cuticle protein 19-like [Danaus plexippus]
MLTQGHGYRDAYSSNHISRHDGHLHPVHGHHGHHYDYYAYPKYEFEYKVADPHTRDFKKQRELRDGGLVKGFYELLQPDGHERRVDYYSNDKIGFQADVKYNINHRYPYARYYRPYPDHYRRSYYYQ